MVYVTHDQTEAMTLGDRVAVMRTGTIQQVASPQELYDDPVNLFVAGFMGSPSMNFMAGTLEDGKLRTSLGDITLTGQLRQEVERSGTGRDVIVGIRPEHFEDAALVPADLRPSGLSFRANIDVIESLGAEKFVYFTKEIGQTVNSSELEELARDSGRADSAGTGETVVARLDPATRIGEGQDAELWADVRKLHVFDPASGRNLTLAATGGSASSASAAPAAAPAQSAAAATEPAAAPTVEDPAPAVDAPASTEDSTSTVEDSAATAPPAGGADTPRGTAGN
jgi:multiple sugar transport system ATP-binding protein